MPRWKTLLVPTAVAVLTFVAFLPALGNDFVSWDDDRNFLLNPNYRGLGLHQLRWMWTTFHMGHYVPLSWMTLGLDYELWGMDARGYHFTNLVLHCAGVVVVYFVALRLLRAALDSQAPVSSGALQLAAGLGVLMYSVHPLRVESVAWATERRDVLSALFVAASVLAYLRFAAPQRTHARRWYWISVGLFIAGLLSKATALTLPAVLLVLNWYPLRRVGSGRGWWTAEARSVYRESLPFVIPAVAIIPLTIVALAPGKQLTFGAKLAVSAYSLVLYFWKFILPARLSPLYVMPKHIDPFQARFIAAYLAVAAALVVAFSMRRRAPAILAATACYLLIITPMLGVVQNGPQIAADRYTYHASPAIAVLIAAGSAWLLAGRGRAATLALASLAIGTLMTLTWRQTTYWHDSERFWRYVLSVQPESDLAHTMVGNFDLAENRLDEAIANYRYSLSIDSGYVDSHNNLGIALSKKGDYAAAAPLFRAALRIDPNDWTTHNNLGIAAVHLGQIDEAITEFGAVVRLNPPFADAHHNLGVALARAGRYSEAVDQFRMTLQLDPEHAEARTYLEKALQLASAPRRSGS